VVLVSLIGLIPGQSSDALGAELLGVSLLFTAVIGVLSTKRLSEGSEPRNWLVARFFVRAAGTLPFVIGGASLIAEAGGGLYWIIAGILFATAGGVANAWVLLIEILR
jgi:hypothetical protein